jgi:hypothetical protein
MPDILEVGMTEKEVVFRLKEANRADAWRPPTPYRIEFAKRVQNPKQKEKLIHTLLSQYTEKVNPTQKFFRVSKEEVRAFFDLTDGDYWAGSSDDEDECEEEEYEDDDE